MMMASQPMMMMAAANQQTPFYTQAPMQPPPPPPVMPQPGMLPSTGSNYAYDANSYYPNQENVDPNEQFYQEYQQEAHPAGVYSDTESDSQDTGLINKIKPDKSSEVNYVETNKKNLGLGDRNTSYSQRLTKKKGLKESPTHSPTRLNKPAKKKMHGSPKRDKSHQSLPNSASGFGMAPTNQVVQKPASAEHLWHMRSRSLLSQKEEKVSGKPKKHKKLDQHQQQHQPVPSFSDPSKPQPIRHTVFTEDGQQLSVDIDLKVLSPTMQGPAMLQDNPRLHPPVHRPAHPPPQQFQPFVPPPFHQPRVAFVPQAYPQQVFASPRQRPIAVSIAAKTNPPLN
jgi:hypothetical protein